LGSSELDRRSNSAGSVEAAFEADAAGELLTVLRTKTSDAFFRLSDSFFTDALTGTAGCGGGGG
jgi:hypothetical protein